jgi:hypothetical protein
MISKIMSGRWLFTIATAVVFVYASLSGKLTNEQIVSITMLVLTFYFARDRKNEGGTHE